MPAEPVKVLVISNFYPPYKIGGYELLCQQVMQELAGRGYQYRVLTSTYGIAKPMVEGEVYRLLTLENDLHFYSLGKLWKYPFQKKQNARITRAMILDYQPDLVFLWGLWALSKNVAVEAERLMGGRVVYYFANPWPIQESLHRAYWDADARQPWRSGVKRVLGWLVKLALKEEWSSADLKYTYAPICSEALKSQLLSAGIPLGNAPVIYEGISLPPYLAQASQRCFNDTLEHPLRLLYVGILAPHKGVHTAIEALAALEPTLRQRARLTILGAGHPAYEAQLKDLVRRFQLEEIVDFRAPIPREALPGFLGEHDVLVLPSIWEEPLALIMQEGLAAGLVVVGSATGGTKEIIRHDQNGLLFEAGDVNGLSQQLGRLIVEPELRKRLSEQGVITAREKFDLHRMVTDLDGILRDVLEKEHAPAFSH